jgi:putative transposase
MARKRYKPEEIVAKLRQVDVLVSQGQNMVDAIRQIGVSEVTYYRWRQEFGGLKSEQVKRLKDLELEVKANFAKRGTPIQNSQASSLIVDVRLSRRMAWWPKSQLNQRRILINWPEPHRGSLGRGPFG